MTSEEQPPRERAKLQQKCEEVAAVGGVPTSMLVKIVKDWLFIIKNYDL